MRHADVGGGIRQKVLAAIASCNSEGGGRQSTQIRRRISWPEAGAVVGHVSGWSHPEGRGSGVLWDMPLVLFQVTPAA